MYSKNYKRLCMLFISVFLFIFLFTGTAFAAESGRVSAIDHHSNVHADRVKVHDTMQPNFAPVAVKDSYKTHMNEVLTVAAEGVLSNDKDFNGSTLTAVKFSDPAHGTVTLNTNGSFTYVPALNFTGTDSFTYKASDGVFYSNTATVNIKVVSATEQRSSVGATGGGWIEYPVSDNEKANFVFALRFNKEQLVKGFFSIAYRVTEGGQKFIYRIRSNSWVNGGLVFTDENEAYFYGDATYRKINTTTDTVVQQDDTARFLVYFLDGDIGDPGTADKISIKVTLNNGTTTFIEVGSTSALVEIGGGNLNIHRGR